MSSEPSELDNLYDSTSAVAIASLLDLARCSPLSAGCRSTLSLASHSHLAYDDTTLASPRVPFAASNRSDFTRRRAASSVQRFQGASLSLHSTLLLLSSVRSLLVRVSLANWRIRRARHSWRLSRHDEASRSLSKPDSWPSPPHLTFARRSLKPRLHIISTRRKRGTQSTHRWTDMVRRRDEHIKVARVPRHSSLSSFVVLSAGLQTTTP